ncbi:hypothetical protein GCM10025859_46960 [Alicyclobacillus fastidiosus]|nr:hypothetical protein GCM10025859_46960 [Alicyclobacillus fastidiosus]
MGKVTHSRIKYGTELKCRKSKPQYSDTLLVREKALQLLAAVPGANNVTFRQAIGDGDIRYQYLIT